MIVSYLARAKPSIQSTVPRKLGLMIIIPKFQSVGRKHRKVNFKVTLSCRWPTVNLECIGPYLGVLGR